jgi:hypothetical protein
MPAAVIAERIGWEHFIRVLRDRVTGCVRRACRQSLPPGRAASRVS